MKDYETIQGDGLIDQGEFEEMLDLASELAAEYDGQIVVHRKYCLEEDNLDNCSCDPLIITPYSSVHESDLEGFNN